MRPHQSCDSFSEAGVGRSQEQHAKAARRRARMWGGRPTWLYLAADGSQPTTRPLGPPAPPTASPHTAGSHHSPSKVPQDPLPPSAAVSAAPSTCLPPCPVPKHLRNTPSLQRTPQSSTPLGGAGLPFLLISIVPMPWSLVPVDFSSVLGTRIPRGLVSARL